MIGPPRILSRKDGSEIHDSVCNALGYDDFTFKYLASPVLSEGQESGEPRPGKSRGFAIQMARQQGRGALKISIDNANISQPVRFLVEYTWPSSREHVYEDIDAAAEASFHVLGNNWQRVMAEARVRLQFEARGGSAIRFLTEQALYLDDSRLQHLETAPSFASIMLETPAGNPTSADPFHQPRREIKIEVLREDERCVYIEVMSQWPQLAPTANGSMAVDPSRIRTFDYPPSDYIRNTLSFMQDNVLALFPGSKEDIS